MQSDFSFWEIRFIDLIVPLLTIAALIIAYFQLLDIRKQKRIEFTYSLYRDFFNYINTKENFDLKNWLFGDANARIDRDKIGDLLEQFEALWSLKRRDMIDIEIAYDLFSYYILKASKATNPTTDEYISQLKEAEKETLGFREDLFEGFQSIVLEMEGREYFQFKKSV